MDGRESAFDPRRPDLYASIARMPMRTPEEQREYQRQWILRRRQIWIDEQGGKCAECGSTDDLEVDHIDPTTKSMHVGMIWSRRKEVRDLELSKCQVLCEWCHSNKTIMETYERSGEAQHGTPSKYHRGCRCRPCTEAASSARMDLRRRRKVIP